MTRALATGVLLRDDEAGACTGGDSDEVKQPLESLSALCCGMATPSECALVAAAGGALIRARALDTVVETPRGDAAAASDE